MKKVTFTKQYGLPYVRKWGITHATWEGYLCTFEQLPGWEFVVARGSLRGSGEERPSKNWYMFDRETGWSVMTGEKTREQALGVFGRWLRWSDPEARIRALIAERMGKRATYFLGV